METAADVVADIGRLALTDHPDNVALTPDNEIIVAAYTDLLDFAAYRFRWFGTDRVASKILAAGPSGSLETLFEDKEGALFSAASSAVLSDLLIAGSAGDAGLLVCQKGKTP